MNSMRIQLAALALLASVTTAAAVPPPPNGFYGFFQRAEISCPTKDAVGAMYEAIASPDVVVDPAKYGCQIGYLPGPVAVGESALLGTITKGAGAVTFYSVHVGTSEKEWWLLYADTDGAK